MLPFLYWHFKYRKKTELIRLHAKQFVVHAMSLNTHSKEHTPELKRGVCTFELVPLLLALL